MHDSVLYQRLKKQVKYIVPLYMLLSKLFSGEEIKELRHQ
jgi:hypothetical protein